jgi:hypothetical protein
MGDLRGSKIPSPGKSMKLTVHFWFGFRSSGGSDTPFKRHMWPRMHRSWAELGGGAVRGRRAVNSSAGCGAAWELLAFDVAACGSMFLWTHPKCVCEQRCRLAGLVSFSLWLASTLPYRYAMFSHCFIPLALSITHFSHRTFCLMP